MGGGFEDEPFFAGDQDRRSRRLGDVGQGGVDVEDLEKGGRHGGSYLELFSPQTLAIWRHLSMSPLNPPPQIKIKYRNWKLIPPPLLPSVE